MRGSISDCRVAGPRFTLSLASDPLRRRMRGCCPGKVVALSSENQLRQKRCNVRIVPHHQHVLIFGALAYQPLKLLEGRARGQRIRDHDLRFVTRLRRHQLGSLQAALQAARNHQVKALVHRIQQISQVQTMPLAVLVEWPLQVQDRVYAAHTGARVAQQEEVHSWFSLPWFSSHGAAGV